jgi:hypothetical protein
MKQFAILTGSLLKICRKIRILFLAYNHFLCDDLWTVAAWDFYLLLSFFNTRWEMREQKWTVLQISYKFLFICLQPFCFSSLMGKKVRNESVKWTVKLKVMVQSCLCWWVVDGWLRLFWQIWQICEWFGTSWLWGCQKWSFEIVFCSLMLFSEVMAVDLWQKFFGIVWRIILQLNFEMALVWPVMPWLHV